MRTNARRTIVRLFILLPIILAATLVARTISVRPAPEPMADVPDLSLDEASAVARLAASIRIPTISREDVSPDTSLFLALHDTLRRSFPRVHGTMVRETIADLSLLYTWAGSDGSLPPLILVAHLDVVPVATPDAWEFGPFDGIVSGGFVHGRGTTDDKLSVMGILEAAESLLADGFTPRRTVFLAFGHDEETGGDDGARTIALRLQSMGVREAVVLDEGGIVSLGVTPGVARPVAVVGVAEKGSADVRLTATGTGGHSSVPIRPTAIGSLAEAIARLEERPMTARLDGPTLDLLDTAAPHMNWGFRLVFANRWFFSPFITRVMASKPTTDAVLRTTTAPTMISGGVKVNVLPDVATANMNFRIRPGERSEDVLRHVDDALNGLPVRAELLSGSREPTEVSDHRTPAFGALAASIRGTFRSDTPIVAPYLVVGGTDARHYSNVSRQVFRFLPVVVDPSDGLPFHGTDERIGTDAYVTLVRFYATFIRKLDTDG